MNGSVLLTTQGGTLAKRFESLIHGVVIKTGDGRVKTIYPFHTSVNLVAKPAQKETGFYCTNNKSLFKTLLLMYSR